MSALVLCLECVFNTKLDLPVKSPGKKKNSPLKSVDMYRICHTPHPAQIFHSYEFNIVPLRCLLTLSLRQGEN
jgi:hypothetical protein